MNSVLVLLVCITAVYSAKWNYDDLGPDSWETSPDFPSCRLRQQSPVNIQKSSAKFSPDLTPFTRSQFTSDVGQTVGLNNGHSLAFSFDGWTLPYGTANLTGEYKAVNMHMHWGTQSSGGSEHTFNYQQTFGEMHFVHYNTKYPNISAAVQQPDGLAVLGVMLQNAGVTDNPAFTAFDTPSIGDWARFKNDDRTFDSFNFGAFFPRDLSLYYRYQGSLTTPGCFESVTWTVFNDPVQLSNSQALSLTTMLNEFEESSEANRVIVNNFRPTQRLYNRQVSSSRVTISSSSVSRPSLVLSVVMTVLAAVLYSF